MNIKLFGYQGQLSPTPLMASAFTSLGHEIVQDGECDLVYDITGGEAGFEEYKAKYPRAKTISTLLNADILNPNWEEDKFRRIMNSVDACVTVSKSTQKDIKDRIGVESSVVYFPLREVYFENLSYRGIDFMYVGRLYNKEKRFDLIKPALKALSYDSSKLVVVGPEQLPEYSCTGFLEDETLNTLYNSARFLLSPCWHEGSMSMLEAIITKTFPVCCTDNEWTHEFGLDDFAAEPDPVKYAEKIQEINTNQLKYKNKIEELIPLIQEKFNKVNVAKRVIEVYSKL